MNNNREKYILFGEEFNKESLIEYSINKKNDPNIEEWEKDIFQFIINWFDNEEFIKVKTSGSTGKPKTIYLKKQHMAASANATLEFLNIKPESNALLYLPAKYIAGKMMIIRSFVGKLNLYWNKPSLNLIIPKNIKFSLLAVIPSMLTELINQGKTKNLEIFENILIGGSSISPDLENHLLNLKNKIWHTYGMTETISHIALRKINGEDRSGFFSKLNNVELLLNINKLLIINYPQIGVNNLLTNDLAEINIDGKFKIKGRIDNVIISGGLKFNPEEIENKLSEIIKNRFFVYGLKDAKLGQKIVLFIEGNCYQTDGEIIQKAKTQLSKTQIPKQIFHIEQFEETLNNKLIRKNYSK